MIMMTTGSSSWRPWSTYITRTLSLSLPLFLSLSLMIMITTGSRGWQPWSTYNTGTSRQTQTLVAPALSTNHCHDLLPISFCNQSTPAPSTNHCHDFLHISLCYQSIPALSTNHCHGFLPFFFVIKAHQLYLPIIAMIFYQQIKAYQLYQTPRWLITCTNISIKAAAALYHPS